MSIHKESVIEKILRLAYQPMSPGAPVPVRPYTKTSASGKHVSVSGATRGAPGGKVAAVNPGAALRSIGSASRQSNRGNEQISQALGSSNLIQVGGAGSLGRAPLPTSSHAATHLGPTAAVSAAALQAEALAAAAGAAALKQALAAHTAAQAASTKAAKAAAKSPAAVTAAKTAATAKAVSSKSTTPGASAAKAATPTAKKAATPKKAAAKKTAVKKKVAKKASTKKASAPTSSYGSSSSSSKPKMPHFPGGGGGGFPNGLGRGRRGNILTRSLARHHGGSSGGLKKERDSAEADKGRAEGARRDSAKVDASAKKALEDAERYRHSATRGAHRVESGFHDLLAKLHLSVSPPFDANTYDLQLALCHEGYDVTPTGSFDEDTYNAFCDYIGDIL